MRCDEAMHLQSENAGLRAELGVSERLRIAMYSSITETGDAMFMLPLLLLTLMAKMYNAFTLCRALWLCNLSHVSCTCHSRQERTARTCSSCVYAAFEVGLWLLFMVILLTMLHGHHNCLMYITFIYSKIRGFGFSSLAYLHQPINLTTCRLDEELKRLKQARGTHVRRLAAAESVLSKAQGACQV